MKKKVVILTGDELRHKFFRRKIALHEGIEVQRSYCETEVNVLSKASIEETNTLKTQHLIARGQSEKDFFELFVQTTPEANSVVVKRGEINNEEYCTEIKDLDPDLIIVYGASIIKEPLLSSFSGRILNVHLGLSPYYRGSATNFWSLVDERPECVGATFMYLDAGIDTGEIIHQIRASYNFFDTPSTVGNRLIKEMTEVFSVIIVKFNKLAKPDVPVYNEVKRYCRNKDFTEASVKRLYSNFSEGMINNYLSALDSCNSLFPIVQNKAIAN